MRPHIPRNFSNNISIAKIFAIIGIAFGHYWTSHPVPLPFMSYWWVTSAVGLLIFSITSGYFTGIKYRGGYSLKSFWASKVYRIGLPFTIINTLLLVLFLVEGRKDLLSVQTVASWLGIHGFWGWFGVPQVGPYGAGLWFMTVLLVFYLLYPLLEVINSNEPASHVFTAFVVLLLLVLDHYFPLGYTLWLTISGFFVGVWMANREIELPRALVFSILFLSIITMFTLKFYFQMKIFSSAFMLVIAFFLVEACRHIVLPGFLYRLFLPMSSWVLTMYVVHMYVIVTPTGRFGVDWLLSLALMLGASYLTDRLTNKVESKLKAQLIEAARTA